MHVDCESGPNLPFPKILVVQLALGVVGLEMVKVATSVVDAGVATGDALFPTVSLLS